MAEIQITPTKIASPGQAADIAATARPAGDSGFAVWSGLTGVWPMPQATGDATLAVAQGPVAGDPLAQWLDQQMGFSGEFTAPPGTDPAIEALAAGLPQMPDTADVTPVPSDDLHVDLTIAMRSDDLPLDLTGVMPSEDLPLDLTIAMSSDDITPTDSMQIPAPADSVPTPMQLPLATRASAAVGQVASLAAGATRSRPAMPGTALDADIPVTTSLPDADAQISQPAMASGKPVVSDTAVTADAAPASVKRASADGVGREAPETSVATAPNRSAEPERPSPSSPIASRDAAPIARAEIALPVGLAETLVDLPFATEPHIANASRGVTATGPSLQTAASDPRPVMQQVAEALVTTRGDRTEIALSPEELGRIRLIMSGPDRSQITIWAERPETLELVRRNADILTQQLAEAGVNAGSLDFRRDDRTDWHDSRGTSSDDDDAPLSLQPAVVRMSPTTLSDRRIDIRL